MLRHTIKKKHTERSIPEKRRKKVVVKINVSHDIYLYVVLLTNRI